jgi:hypothetical protein
LATGTTNSPQNVVNKTQNFADLLPSRAKTLDIIDIEVTWPTETSLKSLGGNIKTLKDSAFKILKEKVILKIYGRYTWSQ